MSYATYSPEDNKLRLYVGRVPRPEYDRLHAAGWVSTPKQDCDFAAVWTPSRRATAASYCEDGQIEDEDQGPADRAADRAERFAGYREKRTNEATGHADTYDSQPSAHGFQNYGRAVRAADRHDRHAGRAVDAWSKAEYWQSRTAGVISHALHLSSPSVRMGRIKTLEAEQRKHDAGREQYARLWQTMTDLRAMTDADAQTQLVRRFLGGQSLWSEYPHPRPETCSPHRRDGSKYSLYSLITDTLDPITGAEAVALWFSNNSEPEPETEWSLHYKLRLAYENQMIEAQGGRAASVEMEVAGWLGGRQIHRVNKSPATGRVTSVSVKGPKVQGWTYRAANVPGTDYALHQIDTERLAPGSYRAPTEEEKAEYAAARKAEKAAKPKATPCPLLNPTEADAEKLQAIWNEGWHRKYSATPPTVLRMTQAQYSSGKFETEIICETGKKHARSMGKTRTRCSVFKVRAHYDQVICITDKPQRALPWEAIAAALATCPTVESMTPSLPAIRAIMASNEGRDAKGPAAATLSDAAYIGWINNDCWTPQWTDKGFAALKAWDALHLTQTEFAEPEEIFALK